MAFLSSFNISWRKYFLILALCILTQLHTTKAYDEDFNKEALLDGFKSLLREQLSDFDFKYTKMNNRMNEMNNLMVTMKEELTILGGTVHSIDASMAAIEGRSSQSMKATNNVYNEVQTIKEEMGLLKAPINEIKQEIGQLKAPLNEINHELELVQKPLIRINQEIKSLKEPLNEIKSQALTIEQLNSHNSNLSIKMETINNQRNDYDNVVLNSIIMNNKYIDSKMDTSYIKIIECVKAGGFFWSSTRQCFQHFNERIRSWDNAKEKCEAHQLVLAEIPDSIALDLRRYIIEKDGTGTTWLGARGNGTLMTWQRNGEQILASNPLWWDGAHSGDRSRCLEFVTSESHMNSKPGQPYYSSRCLYGRRPLCELLLE